MVLGRGARWVGASVGGLTSLLAILLLVWMAALSAAT